MHPRIEIENRIKTTILLLEDGQTMDAPNCLPQNRRKTHPQIEIKNMIKMQLLHMLSHSTIKVECRKRKFYFTVNRSNSKFLNRYSKKECRVPDDSQVLWQVKRVVHGRPVARVIGERSQSTSVLCHVM